MEKRCELIFPPYCVAFLYLSVESTLHKNFPLAPLKVAKLKEKHKGLLQRRSPWRHTPWISQRETHSDSGSRLS